MPNKFSQTLKKRITKTVKNVTEKVTPIVKKEAAKAMKSSTSKVMDQVFSVVSVVSFGLALASPYLKPGDILGLTSAANGAATVNIQIENLTINL